MASLMVSWEGCAGSGHPTPEGSPPHHPLTTRPVGYLVPVTIQPASYTPLLARLDVLVNRLIVALLSVAFAVTASILAGAAHASGRWDLAMALLAACALLGSLGFGLYVFLQLFRMRRTRF